MRRLPLRRVFPPISRSQVKKRTDAANAVKRMVSSQMLLNRGQVSALAMDATSTLSPFTAAAVSALTAASRSSLNKRYERIQKGAFRVFPLILSCVSSDSRVFRFQGYQDDASHLQYNWKKKIALSSVEILSRSISSSILLMDQEPSVLDSQGAAKYFAIAHCSFCLACIMSPHRNLGY
jgi:hypothetical protein